MNKRTAIAIFSFALAVIVCAIYFAQIPEARKSRHPNHPVHQTSQIQTAKDTEKFDLTKMISTKKPLCIFPTDTQSFSKKTKNMVARHIFLHAVHS